MNDILLVGAAGWGNVGDDVIAFRIIDSAMADGKSLVLACGPKALVGLPEGVRQIAINGSVRDRINLIRYIWRSREVYIGGGGLFDDRIPNFYRPFARVATAARFLRTPYHIISVGVGPIRRSGTRSSYRKVFKGAASASVRDLSSLDRLREAGVTSSTSIREDPALWDSPIPRATVPSYDLLINLRTWEVGDVVGEKSPQTTAEIVRHVAEGLNSTFSGSIALVSMSNLSDDDDSVPLNMLASQLSISVDQYYAGDVDEVQALVASSAAVFSMRLHLALLATAYSKPAAAIAYDPKLTQQGAIHGFETRVLDRDFSASSVIALLRSIEMKKPSSGLF